MMLLRRFCSSSRSLLQRVRFFSYNRQVADVLAAPVGSDVTASGWITSVRAQKRVAFLTINDGSSPVPLQVVCSPDDVSSLSVGASVSVAGKLSASMGKEQPVELQLQEIRVIGTCDPTTYPVQPKHHTPEFLREIVHLRPRAQMTAAALRIRSAASHAIHRFFEIHTPLLTTMDCEGAGELFSVTAALAPSSDEQLLGPTPVSLTVSGQLHLETAACALGRVYTFNPAFRADRSTTPRHLCEFWMVEPEIAFANMDDACDIAEDCVRFVVADVVDKCSSDLALIGKLREAGGSSNTGPLQRANMLAEERYTRLLYDEALEALHGSGEPSLARVQWGQRLQAEHERWLCEKLCGGKPVFVTHFPTTAAAFYALEDPISFSQRGPTAASFDLLTSNGELIGGGQREDNTDKLLARMKEDGPSAERYSWYIDLRRFGSVPHAGWGMGFERLLLALTGIDNVRDVVLNPRAPGACKL